MVTKLWGVVVLVVAALGAALGAVAVPGAVGGGVAAAVGARVGAPGPTVFAYTGAPQWYTVPANVDTLFVQAVGGSGGGGQFTGAYQADALGGAGGQVIAELSVTPGEVVNVNVGGAGQDGPSSLNGDWQRGQGIFHIAQGGWNGGADAGFSTFTYANSYESPQVGNAAGGGGGATDIRACFSAQGTICPLADRILVAGGGGGAGMDDGTDTTSAAGGAGGIYQDGSGAVGNSSTAVPQDWPVGTYGAAPGGGATQASGGSGGTASNLSFTDYESAVYCDQGPAGHGGGPGAGQDGALATGGAGGSGHYQPPFFASTTLGGGGGGGGYYGGGGGGCGGLYWVDTQGGIETATFPGTAGGGGGSSWVAPDRVAPASPPQYGTAGVGRANGFLVFQGLELKSTAGPQAFAMPGNAAAVDYTLDGAQGGAYGFQNPGGRGATVTGTAAASAGQIVQVDVGGGGEVTNCNSPGCPVSAWGGPPVFDEATDAYLPQTFAYQMGWNGGGLAVPPAYLLGDGYWGFGYPQAGGGGASDLRLCPGGTTLDAARTTPCPTGTAAIAAGGGGSSVIDAWEASVTGGAGGCASGVEPDDSTDGGAGRGGTQVAGGIGGAAGPSGSTGGQPGTAGAGGDGGLGDTEIDQDRQGAGGGGGYFGGGGGGGGGSEGDTFFHSPGAGGGGSSLVPAGATCTAGTGPSADQEFSSADGSAVVSLPVLVPGQPFNVRATALADPTQAEVTWDANGSFGSAITGAGVEYSSDQGQTWSSPVTAPATGPATVTGLDPSTAYAFRVLLVNSYGASPVSARSNTVRTPATTPGQAGDVVGSPQPDAVSLGWTAPASDGGSPVTAYEVRWSTDGGGTWGDPMTTPGAGTTTVIGGLTSADGYAFEVAAVNERGAGPFSAASPVVTPVGIPTAPGAPDASPGFQQVALSWSPAAVAGAPGNGQSVTDYEIQAVDTVTHESVQLDTGSSATTFTVTGVFTGHPHTFATRGLNGAVAGPWSAASSAVRAVGRASAPTAVHPVAGDRSVALTWSPPSDLGGGRIVGYRIDDLVPGPQAVWHLVEVTSTSATSATVAGLQNGTPYRFRLQAITSVPGGPGTPGTVAGATSAPSLSVVPAAPPPPSAPGYREVGADGGIFAFGDATFEGSMAGRPLAAPVVGIAATADGRGYWEVGADGGIFAFGDATFEGSMAGRPLAAPVDGVA
jgi:hypothetical protein